MAGETMSLEDANAFVSSYGSTAGEDGPPTPRQIQPSVQGARDKVALEMLRNEGADPAKKQDKPTIDREASRMAKTAVGKKTMTLEEANAHAGGVAPPAKPASAPAAPPTPTPAQHEKSFKDQAFNLGLNVAQVGDLLLSLPAQAAGAIGEIGLHAATALDPGVSHRAASQAAAEYRNHIIEKGSPSWFSDILMHVAGQQGKVKPDETTVSQAMGWMTRQIQATGKFVDKKSGGLITEDDVGMAANAAMAALGLLGAKGVGPELRLPKGKEAAKPLVEGTEGLAKEDMPKPQTLEPPQSPREAIERPLKTARQPRTMSDKDMQKMHHNWVQYTTQLANQTASKMGEAKHADTPVLDPQVREAGMKPTGEGVTDLARHQDPLDVGAEINKRGQKVGDEADLKARLARGEEIYGMDAETGDKLVRVTSVEGAKQIDGSLHALPKQAGGVSSKLLMGMAGVGLGMTAGAYLDKDNPLIGAALGGILLAKPVSSVLDGAGKVVEGIRSGDERVRINDITEQHDHSIQRAVRVTSNLQGKIIELVPSRKRREAIHQALDEGTAGSLKGKEKEAADLAARFYASVEEGAKQAGVLEEGRANYSTHLWQEADRDALQKIIDQKAGPPMSPNSRFAKQRAFVTMKEGKAAGLKPLTEDIAEVAAIYGNSMFRSMANAKMLDRLKRAEDPEGNPLVVKAQYAPPNYQTINHPSLQGLRVHPDIMSSMKFMFEAQEPHTIMAAASALNTALKRNAVSFSLFHASALGQAMLGTTLNPLKVGKVIAQTSLPKIFGTNRYLKMLKEGGAGDLVDKAQRDGLRISMERMESVDVDVGGGFYNGMRVLQNAADKAVPFGAGKAAVGLYMRVNHAFDNFMWGRLHAGMKLEVYAAKKEALLENNAKAGHPISEEEAGKIAASYANDIFGGLHWQRLAEASTTKWGRDMALGLNSPRGRMATQLLMFAPDWTLSTSRAFYKTLPIVNKGTGITGLFSAKTGADLYRQQLLRSALYYVAVGDAINYANSGHHIWENKDWTTIDLGDGRRMQLSKHFMEPFHMMTQPGQQALNKLGVIPKEAVAQALHVEYLSSKGRMPPMQDRLRHLGKNVLPIASNQFQEGGMEAGAAGFSGFPIYGKTQEQKRALAKQKREERYKKMLQDYRKSHGLDQ